VAARQQKCREQESAAPAEAEETARRQIPSRDRLEITGRLQEQDGWELLRNLASLHRQKRQIG
jgi:N6-adenosine-specific RNA methylase IME4